jgi:hypothetical protein
MTYLAPEERVVTELLQDRDEVLYGRNSFDAHRASQTAASGFEVTALPRPTMSALTTISLT